VLYWVVGGRVDILVFIPILVEIFWVFLYLALCWLAIHSLNLLSIFISAYLLGRVNLGSKIMWVDYPSNVGPTWLQEVTTLGYISVAPRSLIKGHPSDRNLPSPRSYPRTKDIPPLTSLLSPRPLTTTSHWDFCYLMVPKKPRTKWT